MKLGKKLEGWRVVREVILAVYQLHDDNGSRKHDIQRYIRHNTNFRSFNYKRALSRALKTGLIRMKNGRFFPVSKETLFSRHRHRGALNSKGHDGGERKTVSTGKKHSPRLSHSRRTSTWSRKKGIFNSNNRCGKTTQKRNTGKSHDRCLRNYSNKKRHTKHCKRARFTPSTKKYDGDSFPLSYFS